MGDLSEHFSRKEFACKCGCGFNTVDYELIQVLEKLRAHIGMPITITSGCRCSAYNTVIGGSRNSQHVKGRAADITAMLDPEIIQSHLVTIYDGKYGIGRYSSFTHIDTRSDIARW